MAKAEMEIKVCVERLLHDALMDAIQEIANKHEIFIKDINCKWTDVSTGAKIHMILAEMDVRTHTKK